MSATRIVNPSDLKKIADNIDMGKAKEALDRRRKEEEEQNALRQAFLVRELQPNAIERFNARVQHAAQQGLSEIELLRFPSEYCTDRGRVINNVEAGWPDTLTGIARRGYDAFKQHLEPQGYKMRAVILNYPDGIPGEVGLFISW
jgi:hypothetical protein